MEKPTIFITGSRRGLGRALAEHYLQKGWRVAGCALHEAPFKHECYTHFVCDAGDEKAVAQTLREAVRVFGGRLDALLNNAGTASMNALLLTPRETLEKLTRTNFFGSFFFLREAAKAMVRAKRGRIVNFSSVAAPLHLEGEAVYAATKAAVESLTQTAARELAPYGITVNAVGPTPVDTALVRAVPREKIDALVARQAVKRMGTPQDVCHAVDFFLDEASGFITGQVLYLGGIAR